MPVVKRYLVDGRSHYYHNHQHPGAPIKDLVQVFYQFRNEQRGGLGVPMPSGVVRNHKSTAVAVEVNEPIGGTWRMVRSSHEWTKTSAWAAQFAVPVAADGTTVLKYRVRVTY